MRTSLRLPVATLVAVLLLSAVPRAQGGAAGRTGDRKWEVEVHAGGMQAGDPTTGTAATLPGPGDAFTTSSGRPSRRASSWLFGDGALLVNQMAGAFTNLVPQRMTPLDPLLASSMVRRRSGWGFGVRVSRTLTRRFSVEATTELNSAALYLTREALQGLEASDAGFEQVWSGILRTGPFRNAAVDAASTIRSRGSRQLMTTVALNMALRPRGLMTPYVTAGAGVISSVGDAPSATIAGSYRFQIGGVVPVNETDTVTVRQVVNDHAFVGVLGGGLKYAMTPRWGVRVDGRLYVSGNPVDTFVDATPNVATGTPASFIASTTTPSLQFSNNPSTGQASNLTGPRIAAFRSFDGTGTQVHVAVTTGIYWRF